MRKYNVVNVLDTELTCYPDNVFPAGEQKEIIQIGLCMVDLRSLQVLQRLSIPVVPVRSQVSQYCTELTGWTSAKLKRQGVPFAEACRRLRDCYASVNRLVVTDSDAELEPFRTQCQLDGIENPFGLSVLNVSTMYTLLTNGRRNARLPQKLETFGMQFEGKEHRADVDAYNIARLFIHLVKNGRQLFGFAAQQSSAAQD